MAVSFGLNALGTVRFNNGVRFGQAGNLPEELFSLEYQSNARGEIVVDHLPPDVSAEFLIDEQLRFPPCTWRWSVNDGEQKIITVPAARQIRGQVLADDTGEPLAGASVTSKVSAVSLPILHGFRSLEGHATTDAGGKFALTTALAPNDEYNTVVHAPAGSTYLDKTLPSGRFGARALPDGDLQIRLERGSLVAGHVIDADTGRPVPDAVIWYSRRADPKFIRSPGGPIAISDRDGNFSFAVEPVPAICRWPAALAILRCSRWGGNICQARPAS